MTSSQLVGTYARRKLETLIPYPGNARRGNVPLIAESLDRYGQYKPVVVQVSTGFVLAGNHTLAASKSLGWTHLDCQLIDCDDETAARINVLDNRSNDVAEYDLNALAAQLQALDGDLAGTGWADDDLATLLAQIEGDKPKPAHTDPDDAPPVPAVPITQLGDVWELGPHRLVCGDSTNAEHVALLMASAELVMSHPRALPGAHSNHAHP